MKKQFIIATVALASFFYGCKKDNNDPEPSTKTQEISGDVSGTWTKGNTYKITDDIYIQEGQSLTIEEGVTVLFSDTIEKPEVIVKGNLYAMGTASNPVKFTVSDSLKSAKPFGQLWGGIIVGPKSTEVVIQNAIIEYGGATTTESSASVKAGLYKAEAGENVPVLYTSNVDGKLVFTNNTIRHFGEDGLYIEGGKVIIANNIFHTTGIDNGDAINIKSGVLADVAFNLVYSPNTNALKLSNSDERTPQAHVIAYNNTIISAGWRRPTVKGGSIWVEETVHVNIHNNLLVNNRFGIKRDTKSTEDDRSTFSNNYFYGYEQTMVDQFQITVSGMVAGTNDVAGILAGANDPQFESFPLSNDKDNSTFSASWDFHLKSGSPAIGKGKTDFTRHFSGGLSVNGSTYTSPEPATYVGAYGTK